MMRSVFSKVPGLCFVSLWILEHLVKWFFLTSGVMKWRFWSFIYTDTVFYEERKFSRNGQSYQSYQSYLVINLWLSFFLFWSLAILLFVTCYHSLYLSLPDIRWHSLYHSLPLVFNRYITRLCFFVNYPVTRVCWNDSKL